MNEYALQALARDRLADMRAAGERSSRIQAAKPRSRPLRVAVGHALIRLGHRLQGGRESLLALGAGGVADVSRISAP